jgi:hypothetical protein
MMYPARHHPGRQGFLSFIESRYAKAGEIGVSSWIWHVKRRSPTLWCCIDRSGNPVS